LFTGDVLEPIEAKYFEVVEWVSTTPAPFKNGSTENVVVKGQSRVSILLTSSSKVDIKFKIWIRMNRKER